MNTQTPIRITVTPIESTERIRATWATPGGTQAGELTMNARDWAPFAMALEQYIIGGHATAGSTA